MLDYFAALVAAGPVPPPEILDRPITPDDVRAFPEYFILGPGRERASATLCDHGYTLVDSCPGCDATADR